MTGTSDGTLLAVPDQTQTGTRTRDVQAERSGRHWKRWEVGQLLEAAQADGDGFPATVVLAEVAEAQKRSVEGVRRKLGRLIAGEDECPDEYRPVLDAVKRQAAQNAPKPDAKPPAVTPEDRQAEQYRAIGKALERLEAILDDIRSVAEASLAVGLADGSFPPSALSIHVTPRLGRHLVAWATDINAAYRGGDRPAGTHTHAQGTDEINALSSPSCPAPTPATGPGESALDETDNRWQDRTLAEIGIPPAIAERLRWLKPPVITVGDWDDLLASPRQHGLTTGIHSEFSAVYDAVEAFKNGASRR